MIVRLCDVMGAVIWGAVGERLSASGGRTCFRPILPLPVATGRGPGGGVLNSPITSLVFRSHPVHYRKRS